jgi:hypothetical protein
MKKNPVSTHRSTVTPIQAERLVAVAGAAQPVPVIRLEYDVKSPRDKATGASSG